MTAGLPPPPIARRDTAGRQPVPGLRRAAGGVLPGPQAPADPPYRGQALRRPSGHDLLSVQRGAGIPLRLGGGSRQAAAVSRIAADSRGLGGDRRSGSRSGGSRPPDPQGAPDAGWVDVQVLQALGPPPAGGFWKGRRGPGPPPDPGLDGKAAGEEGPKTAEEGPGRKESLLQKPNI